MDILQQRVYTDEHRKYAEMVWFGVKISFANMCFHGRTLTFIKSTENETQSGNVLKY